jgi:hypothetical protein
MNATSQPRQVTLEDVAAAISKYHETYRHPKLTPLRVSGFYDLHDHEPTSVPVESRWSKDGWPSDDRPGVYLIWDETLSLRYVGRATKLGVRLHSWFKTGPDDRCVAKGRWLSKPRFIATIRVEQIFEAGALEEYLMGAFGAAGPQENATPWYQRWLTAREDS